MYKDRIRNHRFVIGVFVVYIFIGITCFKHYGISFDEPINRINAIVTANYLMETFGFSKSNEFTTKIPSLHNWKDRDYGVAFEFPLLIIEKVMGLNSDHKSRELYLMRHLVTFLTFYISVIFFYMTAYKVSQNRLLSTLVTGFLILSPRIFAESFYNGKDIICLAFFIITSFFLVNFLKSYSLKDAIYLGVFSAITINIRLIGILFPVVTIFWIVVALLQEKHSRVHLSRVLSLYTLITIGFTICIWPYLWESPLHNFVQAFKNMSKFRFYGQVLFMGKRMPAPELPWYYIPAYMLFTIPVLYWLFFVTGVMAVLSKLIIPIKNVFSENNKIYVTFLLLFFVPILSVILLHSVTYDGWRQFYFLYGSFMIIVLWGMQALWQKTQELKYVIIKWSFWVMIFGNLLFISYWMIQNHPHQNVYFNILAGKSIENDFDRDYWGLSYKQALEYIAKTDKRDSVIVIANLAPGRFNHFLLRASDKKRFIVGDIHPLRRSKGDTVLTCDYFVTEYRTLPDPSPFHKKLHSIKVDDFEIMAVFDGTQKK